MNDAIESGPAVSPSNELPEVERPGCRIPCESSCEVFLGPRFPRVLRRANTHCMFHHRQEAISAGFFRHDPVACDGWSILNGIAHLESSVAYAVRDGNMAAMRMGIVRGYTVSHPTRGRPKVKLKIEMTGSSDFGVIYGRVVSVETLERIVLIAPGTGRWLG